MGAANAEIYIQSQDHQTTYPAFGEKMPPAAEGDNGPAQGLNNLDHLPGLSSSDVRDADKEPSMYSYSKVSRDLKEESFMMRQLRDQALASKSQSKRLDSPTSMGGMGGFSQKDDQLRADDTPTKLQQ
jgi:hypothetical protein